MPCSLCGGLGFWCIACNDGWHVSFWVSILLCSTTSQPVDISQLSSTIFQEFKLTIWDCMQMSWPSLCSCKFCFVSLFSFSPLLPSTLQTKWLTIAPSSPATGRWVVGLKCRMCYYICAKYNTTACTYIITCDIFQHKLAVALDWYGSFKASGKVI